MSYPGETQLNQISELQLKVKTLEKTIEELKTEEKKDFEPEPALNYYVDVRRLNRHCKMLDKRIRACRDDDKMVKLLNCLGFIQGKKKEYGDIILDVDKILREGKQSLRK